MSEGAALLPRVFVPRKYLLHFVPKLHGDFRFVGETTIEGEIVTPEESGAIVLHALELEVISATLNGVPAVGIEYDSPHAKGVESTVTMLFPAPLRVGAATLQVRYIGVHNDKMAGFYRSAVPPPPGSPADSGTVYMGVTQFEACDARRAFPCVDEPAAKATFVVSLDVDTANPATRTVLSNMPASSCVPSPGGGTQRITFAETPVMSTYLVAVVVGSLECVSAVGPGGVAMRVWTPPGKSKSGEFALGVAVRALQWLGDFFGVPYALPKCDMVAVPDFAAGAMENWGLVTYREARICCDAATTSTASKLLTAETVAHELAHQWFGNLVTMRWWDELWLNEGFAVYMASACIGELYPAWDSLGRFASLYAQRALQADAVASSHPIQVVVRTSSEAQDVFDAISYFKGAVVIRMLATRVGFDALKRGLQTYIRRHAYANTTTADLWRAISEAAGVDVASFMTPWVTRVGYPVVHVAEDGALTQRHFSTATHDPDRVWAVPLALALPGDAAVADARPAAGADDAAALYVLEGRSGHLPSEFGVDGGAPVPVVNAGVRALCRVRYAPALAARIDYAQLAAVDRLALVSDAFALAAVGEGSVVEALGVARRVLALPDTAQAVWVVAEAELRDVASVWAATPLRLPLVECIRTMLPPAVAAVGWEPREGEGEIAACLRAIVLGLAVDFRDAPTLAAALARHGADISPDLRGSVLRAVVRDGGRDGFARVLAAYRASSCESERLRCAIALGSARGAAEIAQVLDFALGPTAEVKRQDSVFVASALARSEPGRAALWAYVKAHWARLVPELAPAGALLGGLVKTALAPAADLSVVADVEAFFSAGVPHEVGRAVPVALDAVRARAKWRERDTPALAAFLGVDLAAAHPDADATA